MNRRVRFFGGPDEDVDEMLAASVDQSGDVAFAKHIQAAANQREALVHEIVNGRNEIEFAVEPGLDGVLVRGSNVGEMPCLQRANVRVDDFRGRNRTRRVRAGAAEVRHGEPGHAGYQEQGSGNRKPAPSVDRRAIRSSRGALDVRAKFFAQLVTQLDGGGFIKL